MKKKFLEILKRYGLVLVDYETWNPTFDWRNYQIKYRNRNNDQFDWFGRVDRYDDNLKSLENRHGILDDFEKNVLINRGGR